MERPGRWRGFGSTSFTVCELRSGATMGSGLSQRLNSRRRDELTILGGWILSPPDRHENYKFRNITPSPDLELSDGPNARRPSSSSSSATASRDRSRWPVG